MTPDGNTLPMWNFELCNVETADAETMKVANDTLDAYTRRAGIGPQTRVGTLSRVPIAAAQLGRADAVRYMLPAQLRAGDAGRNDQPGIFRNRMALREGPGATECERLGRVAEALHTALLHSAPPAPGGEPIVRVFPAWPKEWDATYTLLARGGFLVTASMDKGRIAFVQIKSQVGGECRVRNPWPDAIVVVVRDGKSEETPAAVITLKTTRGELVTLHPKEAAPTTKKVS
jgi:hypothetical protein